MVTSTSNHPQPQEHDRMLAPERGAAQQATRPDGITRWCALGGVVGPIIFVLAFSVAGLLRTDYSPIHQAVSDLGVGANAWLLNGSLVLLAPLLTACAVAVARGLRTDISRPQRWLDATLLALPGIGFAVAGVFTEAPPTLAIHWMVGMPLVVVGSVAGFFLAGLSLRRVGRWRGWGTYSFIASVATLVLVLVMFWVFTPGTPVAPAKLGGLMERVLFVEILVWYVYAGWRLFSWSAGEGRVLIA